MNFPHARNLFAAFTVLLCGIAFGHPAAADVITQLRAFSGGIGPISRAFNEFDSEQGTLDEVRINVMGNLEISGTTAQNSSPFTYNVRAEIGMQHVGPRGFEFSGPLVFAFNNLTATGNGGSFSLARLVELSFAFTDLTDPNGFTILDVGADGFDIAPATINGVRDDFKLDSTIGALGVNQEWIVLQPVVAPTAPASVSGVTFAGSMQLDYIFTSAQDPNGLPAPGGLATLLLGLGAIGLARRRDAGAFATARIARTRIRQHRKRR